MKVHLHNPITLEFEGWPATRTQQELNSAPRWHKRWQRIRCTLGFHYFAKWGWEYGHKHQFRMCQRWPPECLTTDWRPRKRLSYPVTFPMHPLYLIRWRVERWRR